MALPKYESKHFVTFLQDMRRAGRKVFHYHGMQWYRGPAVKIKNLTELEDIVLETSVVTNYEQEDNGLVVHPYHRGE